MKQPTAISVAPLVRVSALLASLSTLLLASVKTFGFELDGTKWFLAQAEYHVDMEGMSATQISWNTAFIEAIEEWNANTVFEFSVVNNNADPCLDNGISSVDFSEDFCGSSFGNNVLAVTVRRFDPQILGPPYIREADIIVNAEEEFDIFDGPLVQFGQNFAGLDFGRVALHELGHVIGLDHEETNNAIMAPNISNLFSLQQDDINGVQALHNGLSNCEIDPLTFGEISEVLNGNDCTVKDLTVGGNDNSFLDLYQFDLDETTQLDFFATSTILDPVLILATTDLQYLDVDIASNDDCDSSLSANLPAGSYFLIVNTFDSPIKEDCGIVGNYRLRTSFTSSSEPSLGSGTSLANAFTTAQFTGGITADNGATYSNQFSPTDSLDISAQIRVDIRHRGAPGFLVVAALLEGQVLMLNADGEFVDVTANPLPAVPFATKTLETFESITIATDLVPADLGIQDIDASIVVGYGLDSNPSEIYYHSTPLSLSVVPDSGAGD
ncbi:MAG: matrixin family metalloprotease [Pseudomonadales bacterium]|nr:matrixin family metalloprotease [Pseudomonadales bacterium]